MTAPVPALPPAFAQRMKQQLGAEAEAYFTAMAAPYVRGLRLNPRKPGCPALVKGLLDPIPWEPNGYFLSQASPAGNHPLHEAGAYYLQEPSAMAPARLLSPQPGEKVLDLCAAPGGKSTQLADMLGPAGLLCCNEPVLSRAQVLSRNLERMGIANALVVSADPDQLARAWANAFDAVLVDAPCSGEGMFRRHPETRLEWREVSPASCALRQRRILESAYSMLKPGGRLVYSTCTFSPQENEDAIAAFLAAHPDLTSGSFSVPAGDGSSLHAQDGMLRLYPHRIQGEGHFIALLTKNGRSLASARLTEFHPPGHRLQKPPSALTAAYSAFQNGCPLPPGNAIFGDTLLHAPPLPPLDGIRVLRAGLHLGQLKGKHFFPDHALAMGLPLPFPSASLSLEEARLYQRGEALALKGSTPGGFALATYEGLTLGFGKASDGHLKNHYPKGLRRP